MIIGSLKNTKSYEQINPYFKETFDYLKKLDLKSLSTGKNIIIGDDKSIINVNETLLKAKTDAFLEAHNKYIDIQIPLSSAETFGWKIRSTCENIKTSFDPEKDIEFYNDNPTTYFTLQPEEFVIFFPEDAHAPCIGDGSIKKIVVKVEIN